MAEQTIYKRTSNKRGHNKGIARAAKANRRLDAEERNARTPLEHTRAYRRTHGV